MLHNHLLKAWILHSPLRNALPYPAIEQNKEAAIPTSIILFVICKILKDKEHRSGENWQETDERY